MGSNRERQREHLLTLYSLHPEEESSGSRWKKCTFVNLTNWTGKTERWKSPMSKVSVAETEAENWCEDRKISVYSWIRTWVLSICRQALNLCTTTTTALLTLLSTFGLYRPDLNRQKVLPTMLISLGIRLKTGWQWNNSLPCLPIVWWFTHRDFQLVQFNDKHWKSKAEQKKNE